jgi:hypothetical protein
MSTDLAARLRAVVEERLAVARAATPGPWDLGIVYGTVMRVNGATVVRMGSSEANAEHIALNDPADVILACEHALWVLDQHRWVAPRVNCGCDQAMCSCGEHVPWPCEDLQRLATRYRVEVDGG